MSNFKKALLLMRTLLGQGGCFIQYSNVENDVFSNEDIECEAIVSSAFIIEILFESLAAFDFVESASRPILSRFLNYKKINFVSNFVLNCSDLFIENSAMKIDLLLLYICEYIYILH